MEEPRRKLKFWSNGWTNHLGDSNNSSTSIITYICNHLDKKKKKACKGMFGWEVYAREKSTHLDQDSRSSRIHRNQKVSGIRIQLNLIEWASLLIVAHMIIYVLKYTYRVSSSTGWFSQDRLLSGVVWVDGSSPLIKSRKFLIWKTVTTNRTN